MADLLEQLPGAERYVLVESLDTSLEAITYTHLNDAVREDIIENFDNVAPASVVVELEYDDAVDSTRTWRRGISRKFWKRCWRKTRYCLKTVCDF
jgi:Mg/Co/Ni transporter MgtE